MEEILDNDLTAKSNNAPVITKDKAIYRFSNFTADELADKLQGFFDKKGYALEEGTKTSGIYGKGNRIMRVLFGAFVKRFAWNVRVEEESGAAQLTFSKNAKGYIGGAVGVSQVKTEFKSIVNSLTTYHQKIEIESPADA